MVSTWLRRPGIVIALALAGIAAILGAWRQSTVQDGSPVRQIYLALSPGVLTDGSQFWIRVTEGPDKQGATFVGGASYTFYSGPSENGPWKKIMLVRLDDPDPIPTRNVVFVNGRLAYVFLYNVLAVTQDGGSSWSVWEPGRARSDWGARRSMIEDVVLSKDGSGTMRLKIFAAQKEATLKTRDFGESWAPE